MKNYSYFVENTSNEHIRDNSKLFSLIRDLELDERDIFVDIENQKTELNKLLDTIEQNSRLIIRSVVDLSDEAKELLGVLEELQEKSVILCSIEERFLNGDEYYTSMKGFAKINTHYLEKRRQQGYNKAKENGKVGRPRKEVEKAIRLYKARIFSTEEITEMCGISSSTLYRALKEVDKQE
ncbi:MAG: recombinase family protein [Marinisporobacter sp.]|nr:recombinase family protein [Marinisporobacter sp.]